MDCLDEGCFYGKHRAHEKHEPLKFAPVATGDRVRAHSRLAQQYPLPDTFFVDQSMQKLSYHGLKRFTGLDQTDSHLPTSGPMVPLDSPCRAGRNGVDLPLFR